MHRGVHIAAMKNLPSTWKNLGDNLSKLDIRMTAFNSYQYKR